MPERILFPMRSLPTYKLLNGRWMAVRWKYLYSSSVGLHIIALILIRRYLFWFAGQLNLIRRYLFWFYFLDDTKEILNLRICRTKWRIWESSPYGWHRLDVYLTCLASDLGQARQKYVCTVHLWAAYDICLLQPKLYQAYCTVICVTFYVIILILLTLISILQWH